MAVTAGALSLVSKTSTQVVALSAAATAGTGPYTYQWYRSTTSGFSPGGGNILSGKTALSLTDTGLVPGTTYYYKVVATDTGDSNATSTSAQLSVSTDIQQPGQNQFAQSVVVGQIDLPYEYNTISAQIDVSETGTLYPGQAVKIVDSAGGVPKVVACSADTDLVFGFINYNFKNPYFLAGYPCEISQDGNVMWLMAADAIARGAQVVSKCSTTIGGVGPTSGSGGENIVGFALDKASVAGTAIRIKLAAPSFKYDA